MSNPQTLAQVDTVTGALNASAQTAVDGRVDAPVLALGQGRTVKTQADYLAHGAVFHVEDYGAVGDGATDDTAAINAAIAEAWAVGGVVQFGPKAYSIGNLVIPPITTAGDRAIAIRGAMRGTNAAGAKGTRLIGTKADGTDALAFTGNTVFADPRLCLEDLHLIGPGAGSGRGIALIGGACAPMVTMTRVDIEGFLGGAGLQLDNAENGRFDSVQSAGNDVGITLTTSCNANVWINCGVQNNTTRGWDIRSANENVVLGGVVQSNQRTGVYLTGAINWTWIGTHFENNNTTATAGAYALDVQGSTVSGGQGGSCQHNGFLNCWFGTARDTIHLDGVAGLIANDTHFDGGYTNGVASPKVVIGPYAADNRFKNFAAASDITNGGTRTVIEFDGTYTGDLVLGGNANKLGFFGATPAGKQTLPAAATDAASAQALANALRTALIALGLAQ